MTNQTHILIVEDSPSDAKLLLRVLQQTRFKKTVQLVRDGEAALDYLFQRGKHTDAPHPSLVLLDLNLPRLSGLEVLQEIKGDTDLCVIPVLMMTTSLDRDDILNSYRHAANSYINKPNNLQELKQAVETLEQFWFSVVHLPHQNEG